MTACRDYRPSDAEVLSALYEASVRGLGRHRYTPEQVGAWASRTPSPERLEAKMADGRFRLVAGDPLQGFIDVTPDGHIDLLYVAPEARARSAGIGRLYAEASELARPFLERRGFVTTARRDLEIHGVAIHNYAVEKVLDPPSAPLDQG